MEYVKQRDQDNVQVHGSALRPHMDLEIMPGPHFPFSYIIAHTALRHGCLQLGCTTQVPNKVTR